MAYYGFLQSPRIDSATAGRVVQAALTRLYDNGRFLGGFSADVDGYRYVDTNTGNVSRFTGREWIENHDECCTRCITSAATSGTEGPR
jgi:hypothetical protein